MKLKNITRFYVCLKTKHEIFTEFFCIHMAQLFIPINAAKQIVLYGKENLPVVVNHDYN